MLNKSNDDWYKKVYNQLIEKGLLRQKQDSTKFKYKKINKIDKTYYELHHIIPKCIGGTNNKDNLVFLTIKEHYLAHLLLARIYNTNPKLSQAIYFMTNLNKIKSIKLIETFRLTWINSLKDKWKGNKNPNYGKNMTGSNNPASKKVIDPEGNIFNSISECAKFHGITKSSMGEKIRYHMNKNLENGYKLVDSNKVLPPMPLNRSRKHK